MSVWCVNVQSSSIKLTSCLSVAAHSISPFVVLFFSSISFFCFLYLLPRLNTLLLFPPFADLIQVQTLNEQEWERMQQANVLANVAQAFESDMDASDLEEDRETIFSSVDLLSPGGQADAQTLALMLQEQLDAINNEIRYQQLHGTPKPYLYKASTIDYFYCLVIYCNIFQLIVVVWSVKCQKMVKNVDKCSDEILKCLVLSTT